MNIYGTILILSGPSGAGKSSLINELNKKIDNLYFSVSVTTRKKRKEEIDGVDYHFVSKDEFKKDIEKGMFLEWALVHGHYYGTSLKYTIDALKKNKIVLFDIDVQGYFQAKEKFGNLITSVFITTPSIKVLKTRLLKRDTDSLSEIEKRVENAKKELQKAKEYDYFIVNDDFELAKKQLLSIAISSKVKTFSINIDNFIKKWV